MNALRILLAEDDMMIGVLLAEMLRQANHQVCAIVATQAATVSAARQHRPDLMIVDVGLGQGCGVLAVEEILRERFLPHCFMTGNVARATALRRQAAVLIKPFSEPALIGAMRQAMETGTRHLA